MTADVSLFSEDSVSSVGVFFAFTGVVGSIPLRQRIHVKMDIATVRLNRDLTINASDICITFCLALQLTPKQTQIDITSCPDYCITAVHRFYLQGLGGGDRDRVAIDHFTDH
jgi:hypothetical protein